MRLKSDDQRASMIVARGGDRRPHGGRVVRVVVDDRHPFVREQDVEAAAHAAEAAQRRGNARKWHLERAGDGDRGQGILNVHRAGDAQFGAPELARAIEHVETRTKVFEREIRRADAGAGIEPERDDPRSQFVIGQRGRKRVVDADEREAVVGELREKLSKCAYEPGQLVVAVQMIVFDVGNDRHHGFEQCERSIGFVRFGYEPRRRSVVRVRIQDAVDAAEDQAGVDPSAAQNRVRHRAGRGLSVRAADRDAAAPREQLREHLAAVKNLDSAR